jgi:hypothetical protein
MTQVNSGKTLGRPPLSRKLARNNRIVTFVTDEELAGIVQIAENQQKSISAVCHKMLSDSLNSEVTPSAPPKVAPISRKIPVRGLHKN